MIGASGVAILTTIGIVFSLIFETFMFFQQVPVLDFLFGLHWSPQIAIREDQAANPGEFGAIPLFAGTLLITFIAMIVAVPVGLMAAVYCPNMPPTVCAILPNRPLRFWQAFQLWFTDFLPLLWWLRFCVIAARTSALPCPRRSALAAGLVMGTMLIPFISSLSDDVINAVPQTLRDGASALGRRNPKPSNRWCCRPRCRAL